MLPSFIKDRHYRKARKLCEKHVKEVRSPELVENPLLTVLFMTFNHAPFVRQALDSVLMQKTSFRFEIVISDDCSTDGTREIVQEYHEKHPEKIRLLLSDKNLWNFRGNGHGTAIALAFIEAGYRSKYNALLEGDDYWTRDDKLQMQVDFLESNPEYSACYHYAGTYLQEERLFKIISYEEICDNDRLIHFDIAHVSSITYNSNIYVNLLKDLFNNNITGDRLLSFHIKKKGHVCMIHDLHNASIYRRSNNSTYYPLSKEEKMEIGLRNQLYKAKLWKKYNHLEYTRNYSIFVSILQRLIDLYKAKKMYQKLSYLYLFSSYKMLYFGDYRGILYIMKKLYYKH